MHAPLEQKRMDLLRAADEIEQRGLAKHMRQDQFGRFCVHGALEFVVTGSVGTDEWTDREGAAAALLVAYLRSLNKNLHLFPFADDASGWNNDEWRTKEEVITSMRAAAVWYAAQPA